MGGSDFTGSAPAETGTVKRSKPLFSVFLLPNPSFLGRLSLRGSSDLDRSARAWEICKMQISTVLSKSEAEGRAKMKSEASIWPQSCSDFPPQTRQPEQLSNEGSGRPVHIRPPTSDLRSPRMQTEAVNHTRDQSPRARLASAGNFAAGVNLFSGEICIAREISLISKWMFSKCV